MAKTQWNLLTLAGQFALSPKGREKTDRRDNGVRKTEKQRRMREKRMKVEKTKNKNATILH